MQRSKARIIIEILLLGFFLLLVLNIQHAKTDPMIIIVPDDYPTIQEAINNASDGDTILVRAGTYYETVFLTKTVILEGIGYPRIDAERNGSPITIAANACVVNGFEVMRAKKSFSEAGIKVQYHSGGNNIIKSCIAHDNTIGIYVQKTSGNRVINNTVHSNDRRGIDCWVESNDLIANNTIYSNNHFGIILSSSSSVRVEGNTIHSNSDPNWGTGIWISGGGNVLRRNIISNNTRGIMFERGSANTIIQNHISDNTYGVTWNPGISSNAFYHNNFINNTYQVGLDFPGAPGPNIWDNDYPNGGNYWGNYNGTDTNRDGIGDTPFLIDVNNTDNYPLMGMFHSYKASLGKHVNVISNSTVNSFDYSEANNTIRLYVSNTTESQTHGFCRVCIPKELITPSYTITVDGDEPYYVDYSVHDNGTHRWIYIAYEHSIHEVVITMFAHDVDRDGKVNMRDIAMVAYAFGSYPEHPRWNPQYDFNKDERVDMADLILVAKSFGTY